MGKRRVGEGKVGGGQGRGRGGGGEDGRGGVVVHTRSFSLINDAGCIMFAWACRISDKILFDKISFRKISSESMLTGGSVTEPQRPRESQHRNLKI